MHDQNKLSAGLNRRDFIKAGAAGATGLALAGVGALNVSAAAENGGQLPRRRYGRPNYSSGNTNKDGSQKYTFLAGMGLASPISWARPTGAPMSSRSPSRPA